ncbi:MAG: right-handed parallel beta-helix repeat-containing protein [Bacteroidota bacterium]
MKKISTPLLLLLAFASFGFLLNIEPPAPKPLENESPPAMSNVIYVNLEATGNNDGSSWTNAFTDLQDALDTADGDSIWVAKGTYFPSRDANGDSTGIDSRTKTFFADKTMSVFGGFNGSESALSERDLTDPTSVTTLSGQIPNTGNAFNVITLNGAANADVVLLEINGFRISDGYDCPLFNGFFCTGSKGGAGALINANANSFFKFDNCHFTNNVSEGFGGAIRYEHPVDGQSGLNLNNTVFEGNRGVRGGALYAQIDSTSTNGISSNIVIDNCEFISNSAQNDGGAMVSRFLNTQVFSSYFSDNSLGGSFGSLGGGAILFEGVINSISQNNLLVVNTTFENNRAFAFFNEQHPGGGAIMAYSGDITIVDSDFFENGTSNAGNAISLYNNVQDESGIDDLDFLIQGCYFFGHTGGRFGTVYYDSGPSESNVIFGCTFENNRCAGGGAIYSINPFSELSNIIASCGFYDNTASEVGGALYIRDGDMVVFDSEFDGNTAQFLGPVVYTVASFAPDVEFFDCHFKNNEQVSSSEPAFAVHNLQGITVFDNCVFSQNTGGAATSKELRAVNSVFDNDGMSISGFNTIINCTFFNNTETQPLLDLNSISIIENCIIWDEINDQTIVGNPNISVNHCIVSGGFSGNSIIDLPPLFVHPDTGNFQLLQCSPAINNGDNQLIQQFDTLDLNKAPRIIGSKVDLGAYENQEASSPVHHHFINDDTGNDNNRGLSWDCPLATLQAAIERAVTGDTIWVAAGTYYPIKDIAGNEHPSDLRTRTVFIEKDLQIYGGFKGDEDPATFDLTNRDFQQNETILSGDFPDSDKAYHVVYLENVTEAGIFDGFTMTGGLADGPAGRKTGAGIYNINSNLNISNCRFINNEALEGGGALTNLGLSRPTISNCQFVQNRSLKFGGSLFLEGSPRIIDCSFQADTCIEIGGGAIYTVEDALILRCNFTDNYSIEGGAIYTSGNPRIINCRFDNNDSELGGSLHNLNANLTVLNCLFTNSNAPKGSAIFMEGSSENQSQITNCTFSTNATAGASGVLHASDEEAVRIANCIFYGNNGNSIIDENNRVIVYNSIIENGCNTGGIEDCNGNNIFDTDPMFVNPVPAGGDFGLMAGSPAIDAGTNSVLGGQDTDLAGIRRIINSVVDLGTFEFCDEAGGDDCTLVSNQEATGGVEITATVFPNPVQQVLYLLFEHPFWQDGSIEVYTANGLKVKSLSLPRGGRQYSFDVSGLENGFYFLKIKIGESIFTKKVVVHN